MALTNNPVVLGGGSSEPSTSSQIVTGGGVVVTQPGAANGVVVFNTADQTTNFEDVRLFWSSNIAELITQSGGSGSQRQLQIGTASTGVLFTPGSSGAGSIQLTAFQSTATTAVGINFNNAGSFAQATSGTQVFASFTPTYNQASGNAANTDILLNRTQTAVGSGAQLLMDLQVSTVSKFSVSNTGQLNLANNIFGGGSIMTFGQGGIGYSTGAGGAVTQTASRSNGVTLNTICGTITGNATSLAGLASATFTVTNSRVAVGDTIILTVQSGPTNSTTKFDVSRVAAGAFDITIYNANVTTADTGAPLINFAVFKAVSA